MNKKKYIIIFALIVILIASFGLIKYYSNNKNTVKFQQQKAGIKIKQKVLGTNQNNTTSSNNSSGSSNQPNSSSNSSSTSNTSGSSSTSNSNSANNTINVPIEITSANQTNSNLEIRTQINKVTSSGKCTLNMSEVSGSGVINQSSAVQSLASISTCEGFNVPLSSLSSGYWNITINYTSANYAGSVTKQVNIN